MQYEVEQLIDGIKDVSKTRTTIPFRFLMAANQNFIWQQMVMATALLLIWLMPH